MFAVVTNRWGTDGLFKQRGRAERLAAEIRQCVTDNTVIDVVEVDDDPEIGYRQMISLFGDGPAAARVKRMLRHGRTGMVKG